MMKLLCSIIICFSFVGISFSQVERISEDLKSEILINPDGFVKINVEFEEKADLDSLKEFFLKYRIAVEDRPKYLINTLKNMANKSQKELHQFLGSQNNGSIRSVHNYWIINRMIIEIKASEISKMANVKNVKRLDTETIECIPIHPIQVPYYSNDRLLSGIEPGLKAINAPAMWEKGYTGRGLLVYNFDTGVWHDHPSFSDRYLGNRYPAAQSWLGYYRDFPNGIIHDHGTHTLGSILGVDPNTNDSIGVAPRAYWMANDYVATSVNSLPPIEEMIYGFEWALNPDGDSTTTYDIPDVINNSWRWSDEPTKEHCDSWVVDLMNAIELAGIANVFSGGNAGPDNTSVSSPQRINTTVVNTFSVGSIDANQNAPYPISDFSTRGPTQCDGTGSLKIHPQVVAPGQNVRSAWGHNSYNSISGTSMAAPHVSGAILLLKEAFPQLSGAELLWALYHSAKDYGIPGEDNTYGNGLIDIEAAYMLLSQENEPVDPTSVALDLSIEKVTGIPSNNIVCSGSVFPVIHCMNKGDSIIRYIEAKYWFSGQTDSLIEQFDIEIFPGEIAEFALPGIDLSDYGDFELNIEVQAPDDGLNDYDVYNNRIRRNFIRVDEKEVPFKEDFETGIDKAKWIIKNPDFGITWDTLTTSGIENSYFSATMQFYNYGPRNAQKDQLILPNVKLPEENLNLSFSRAYQPFFGAAHIRDSLRIYLEIDCDPDSSILVYEKAGDDLIVSDSLQINFVPKFPWQWVKDSISLSKFKGKYVNLVFESTNMQWNNLYIDNILIEIEKTSNTIILSEKSTHFIHLYPNPAKQNIHLDWSQLNDNIRSINIINNIGLSKEIIISSSRISAEINLDELPDGFYNCILMGEEQQYHKSFVKIRN